MALTQETALSDDYVATLLIEDATSVSRTSSQRPALAPRPNTRFLKNILREADGHNTALKRREEREARHRRREFEREEHTRKRTRGFGRLTPPHDEADDPDTHRKTQSKREHDRRRERHHGAKVRSRSPDRRIDRSSKPSRDEILRDRGSRRRHSSRDKHGKDPARIFSPDRDRNGRKQLGNVGRGEDEDKNRDSRQHTRNRSQGCYDGRGSGKGSRWSRKDVLPEKYEYAFPLLENRSHMSVSPSRAHTSASSASSDPLDEVFGPQPPLRAPQVRGRGRGTLATSSSMDHHFAYGYDASVDVQPDFLGEDDDKWTQALEAMRDRQKWLQNGAQRLRDAGFGESEVRKWEGGKHGPTNEPKEGDIDNVKWSKQGEGREWDRGKILDGDAVEVKADWRRLKRA